MADDTSDLFQEEMNERQELERLRALVVDLKCAGQAMSEELLYFIEAARGDNGDPMAFPAAQLSLTTWVETLSDAGLLWKEELLRANTEVCGELKLD